MRAHKYLFPKEIVIVVRMRILIATPLYPPDIAPSALYVKEYARRLGVHHHVTILAYGHIPEVIPNVRIVTIEKSGSLLVRMFQFFRMLLKEARSVDVVIVENGPSVEVPFVFASLLIWKKKILEVSDTVAQAHASTSRLYRALHTASRTLAHDVRTTSTTSSFPPPRPDIHPFKPYPEKEYTEYEESWDTHMTITESFLKKI